MFSQLVQTFTSNHIIRNEGFGQQIEPLDPEILTRIHEIAGGWLTCHLLDDE